MEKIHIRFMKDLRNHDFGELFDAIYNVAEAKKIDVPSVTIAIDRLAPHCKKLLRMNSVKLIHPLTQLIQKQVAIRTEYLGSLRFSIKAKMLSHIVEERVAAKRLEIWVSPYKQNIYPPTIHRQSRMVEDLMNDRKQKKEIKQATALLLLDDLLEAIVTMNDKIRHNFLIRMNEKEEYVVDGLAIRNAAYDDLKVLISVLESNYEIGTNNLQREQLVELSSSINDNLKDFRTLLRSRTTKKRSKKDADNATKELINSLSKDERQRGEGDEG
ncbi:MAG TPA: DUF6261 family protein [Dysgonamonadaceae bacterium]|nr:DUF6261 family protein [Dysgonamonadaceae bacterium]